MGEFLRNVWDILGAILLFLIIAIIVYIIYLYFAATREYKPPKAKTVRSEVIEVNTAEQKRQEFEERMAIERQLAEKAEEERLRRLKIEDPKQYKKETAGGRWFFIFLSVFAVIFAVLIVLLIATSKK